MQVLTTCLNPPPQKPRTALALVTSRGYEIVRAPLTTHQQALVGAAINRFLSHQRGDDVVSVQNDTYPSALPFPVGTWTRRYAQVGLDGYVDDDGAPNNVQRAFATLRKRATEREDAGEHTAAAGTSRGPPPALRPLLWRHKRQAALAAAFFARGREGNGGEQGPTLRSGRVLPPSRRARWRGACTVEALDGGETVRISVPASRLAYSFLMLAVAALALRLIALPAFTPSQTFVWDAVTALVMLAFLWGAVRHAPVRRSLTVGPLEWRQRNVACLFGATLAKRCGGGGPHEDSHGSTRTLLGAKVRRRSPAPGALQHMCRGGLHHVVSTNTRPNTGYQHRLL